MQKRSVSRLSNKRSYLQVAMNSTLDEARAIIALLPPSDRILIEAGTPLIKRYGMNAIRELYTAALWRGALPSQMEEGGNESALRQFGILGMIVKAAIDARQNKRAPAVLPSDGAMLPYIVADMKTMDRGRTEVEMAAQAGASGIIALGSAPIETLNSFVLACEEFGVDAMIDMMNVEFPLAVLHALKKQPRVVVLHRGVDEERDNKQKMLPLHEIRRIKGAYDSLIAVAGGDTPREVQSASFNDADIVVVWKSVFEKTSETASLVETFLKTIK